MKQIYSHIAFACVLAGVASAQVIEGRGVSPYATSILDFDSPVVPVGPINAASSAFDVAGINLVFVTGAWGSGADTISAGTNDDGSALVVTQGELAVGGLFDALDGPGAGAGLDFRLDGSYDEFGFQFVDQVNFPYRVQLFAGATPVGDGTFQYDSATGFPSLAAFVRNPVQFDRVLLTFPDGAGGVALDDIYTASGPPPQCVESTFDGASTTSGPGGAVYFDVETMVGEVIIEIEANFDEPAGFPAGLMVYTKTGSHVANETNAGAWSLAAVDNGTAVTAGVGNPTRVVLQQPVVFFAGTTGVALVAVGVTHTYSVGNAAATSADGRISVSFGSSTSQPFTGSVFTPRSWNGRLCPIIDTFGETYCQSTPNSTGNVAGLEAVGSRTALANDFKLAATNTPPMTFGQFLCGQFQGFTPNAGQSQGNLCLSLPIGRLVGGGVFLTSPNGFAIAQPNLFMLPQPSQFVVVSAGETWNFQFWFRDIAGGMQTSNYSNAIEIAFE